MPYDEAKTPDVGCDVTLDMPPERRFILNYIISDLQGLLTYAQRNGFIVRVDTVSLEPLAMRNVRMVGHVRGAR